MDENELQAELKKIFYVRIKGTNKYYCGLIYLDRSKMEYSFQNDDADICIPLPVTREKADELIRENPSLEMISAYELIYTPPHENAN